MSASSSWSRELRDGHASASLVPRAEPKRLHASVLPQHFGDAGPQRASALPVDDAKRLEVGADGGVERLHDDVVDVADSLATKIDLARHLLVGQVAHDRNRFALSRLLLE